MEIVRLFQLECILVAGCADMQNFHLYIKIFQTLCIFANQAVVLLPYLSLMGILMNHSHHRTLMIYSKSR